MGTRLEVENWSEFLAIKRVTLDGLRSFSLSSRDGLTMVPTSTLRDTLEIIHHLDSYILLLEEMVRAAEVDLAGLRAYCRSLGGRPSEAHTYAKAHGGQATGAG